MDKLVRGGSIRNIVAFRLLPGEDVLGEIEAICAANHIDNGVILSAVGSLGRVSYCIPEDKGDGSYSYGDPEVREACFSLSSLCGMICRTPEGGLLPHVHMTAASKESGAIAGHMTRGCTVLVSVDVVIGEFSGIVMGRRYDEALQMPVFSPLTEAEAGTVAERNENPLPGGAGGIAWNTEN